MLTTIPFSGFYYSVHSDNIDREIEVMNEDLENADISDYIDFRLVHTQYAQEYLKQFIKTVNELLSLEYTGADFSGIKFESLDSPREYNFETDRLFAEIPQRDVLIIYALVRNNGLKEYVANTFESRPGFVPYYSWNVDDWDLYAKIKAETADHNEIGSLLAVLVQRLEIEADDLMDDVLGTGIIDKIIWDAMSAEGKELMNAGVTP